MKKRYFIIIAVLSVIIFAAVLMPARLVLAPVMASVTESGRIAVDKIGGTLWDGYVQGRLPNLNNLPVVVGWDLKGLRLLMGELALNLQVESREFRLHGDGYAGLWGKGVRALNGDFEASLLRKPMEDYNFEVDGGIRVQDVAIGLSGQRFNSASGSLGWDGGMVKMPDSDGLEFPGLRADIVERDGNLIVPLTETRDNQSLGELGLMLEQKLYSVLILKRVLRLTNMIGDDADQNDDEALFKQQQPLPF